MRDGAIIDGHVHICRCFSISALFDAAWRNMSRVANALSLDRFSTTLLLVETHADIPFRELRGMPRIGEWINVPTAEPDLALLFQSADRSLDLIAGRQLVTEEGLEVLALVTNRELPDGQPLEQVIGLIREAGGVPVLPWAAGKWIGRRGRIVRKAAKAPDPPYLADNGGRPWFWPDPARLAGRQPILSGSDPLPLPGQEERVGAAGFHIAESLGSENTSARLRELLSSPDAAISRYGAPRAATHFLRDQLRLRGVGKRIPFLH